MSFSNSISSSFGNSYIDFYLNDGKGLKVTIDTDRLHIRSVEAKEEDFQAYAELYGDSEVMEKVRTGHTKSRTEIEDKIKDIWAKAWKDNQPYSAFAIFKKDEDDLVGNIVLAPEDIPGQAHLSYAYNKRHWGKGYGKEAAQAIVKDYAPATLEKEFTIHGKRLEEITATARHDNKGSLAILRWLGMTETSVIEKYGALRHHFSIKINDPSKPI